MKLKLISKMALLAGIAVSITSCSLDDDNQYVENPEVAYGAIINASPNSGDLFFYADENQINNTALAYTGAEGYYSFHLGERQLSIKDVDNQTLATADITLEQGEYFSAFAVNTFDNIELVTYSDSLVYPSSGKALVRYINLSPDAPEIDVVGINATFAENLAFKEATGFAEIPSGSYDLTYKVSETGQTLFSETAVNFYAGHIYTVYTKGYVTTPAGSNDTFSAEHLTNW